MISGINNTSNENLEKSTLSTSTNNDKDFSSIFDINKNGKIDASDFSQKDLENKEIAKFLKENNGSKWNEQLENFIKPFLDKSNSENLQTTSGKHTIRINNDKIIITKGKETKEFTITTQGEVKKDDIQNLLNILSSLTPEELEDFKKELNGINLTDDVFFGGLGFYNLNDDTMDLSTNPKAYGIVKTTLVHELGHGVSSKYKYEENKGKLSNLPNYSYSKDLKKTFGNNQKVDEFFKNLKNKYNKKDNNGNTLYGDLYATRNVNEFFAEYYLYKKEGKTAHGSEKLFEAIENSDNKQEKELLKIMNKSIKIPKKEDNLRKK